MVMISPRHLEACLTRTGQILVEGEYNGILKPDLHYIPLKADFSNLQEVFDRIQDEPARLEMVECAYRDIVATGRYTYRGMVNTVLEHTIGTRPRDSHKSSSTSSFLFIVNRMHILLNIGFVYIWSRMRDFRNWIARSQNWAIYIKVLIFTTQFYAGGFERLSAELAIELNRLGIQADILSQANDTHCVAEVG